MTTCSICGRSKDTGETCPHPEGPKGEWTTEQREAHLAGWQRQRLDSGPTKESYPEALRGYWNQGWQEAAEAQPGAWST